MGTERLSVEYLEGYSVALDPIGYVALRAIVSVPPRLLRWPRQAARFIRRRLGGHDT
jgi:hypothetical protein